VFIPPNCQSMVLDVSVEFDIVRIFGRSQIPMAPLLANVVAPGSHPARISFLNQTWANQLFRMLTSYGLRRSFYPTCVGFELGGQIRHFAQPIRNTSGHGAVGSYGSGSGLQLTFTVQPKADPKSIIVQGRAVAHIPEFDNIVNP